MGLLASANIVVRDSDTEEQPTIGAPTRWIAGFSYRPESCNGGGIYDPLGGGNLPAPDDLEAQIDVVPFEVVGSDAASAVGSSNTSEIWAERIAIARRDLLACEQKQIEKELWSGALTTAAGTGNRFLRDSHVTLPEGDHLIGFVTALATLEQAIADGLCGDGMIHATKRTVTMWDQNGVLRRVGNQILTVHDTIVVAGAGYDGKAPAAGAAGLDPAHAGASFSIDSAWAYATGIVDVRLGAVHEPDSMLEQFAPTTNERAVYVDRLAAVTWGCLQVGVHVDHINAISTTGS